MTEGEDQTAGPLSADHQPGPCQVSVGSSSTHVPILHMGKPRLRDAKSLAQDPELADAEPGYLCCCLKVRVKPHHAQQAVGVGGAGENLQGGGQGLGLCILLWVGQRLLTPPVEGRWRCALALGTGRRVLWGPCGTPPAPCL